MKPNYLLGTSALGMHLLNGRGADFVADCLRRGAAVCVLSRFELAMLLQRHQVDWDDADRYWNAYRNVVQRVLPVDEAVADSALALRRNAISRLPMADACIAACAIVMEVPLIHADDHFNSIGNHLEIFDLRYACSPG